MINVNDLNPQMINDLIEKVDRLEKMLYDFNAKGIKKGIIKGIKVQQVTETFSTEPEVVLSELYKNENGGLYKINDINGMLNVKIGSESGLEKNIGGTVVLYNDGESKPRTELGISKDYDSGTINLKDYSGKVRAALYADSNLGPIVAIIDSNGVTKSYLSQTGGKINGENILTVSGNNVYLPNGCYIECLPGRLILHADSSNYLDVRSSGAIYGITTGGVMTKLAPVTAP